MAGYGNGITIGAGSKSVSGSGGGLGTLEFLSNDSSSQLQAFVSLVTDPTGSNRRLSLGAIEQDVAWRNITLAESGGNVGIGMTNPVELLNLGSSSTNATNLRLDNLSAGGHAWIMGTAGSANGAALPAGSWYLYDASLATPRMTVLATGYVGIGTTNPQHLLHVAGTIGAEELIVSATGADYVFAPDHHLRPLTEVAAYIEQNHHLPDIPSAAEVKEKGVSVGDMESKLLAKIEELTLHMIELEQQNRELKDRVARVEAHAAAAK
jgi:hypothetical protein